jgi:hypothetical protein
VYARHGYTARVSSGRWVGGENRFTNQHLHPTLSLSTIMTTPSIPLIPKVQPVQKDPPTVRYLKMSDPRVWLPYIIILAGLYLLYPLQSQAVEARCLKMAKAELDEVTAIVKDVTATVREVTATFSQITETSNQITEIMAQIQSEFDKMAPSLNDALRRLEDTGFCSVSITVS